MAAATAPPAIWKHIGLHGHSVGTFIAEPNAITWKSALMREEDNVVTSRSLPSRALASAQWTIFGRSGYIRVQSKAENNPQELRLDGFPPADYEKVRDTFKSLYDLDLVKHTLSSAGASFGNTDIQGRSLLFKQCILEDADEEGEEFEPRDGEEMLSMNLAEVSQCVLPGNNRNEIELQFHETDTAEAGTDQLVAIRFYIPPDPDADPSDRDAPTSAELFQQRIMKMAKIKNTTGDVIVEFTEENGTFLTPRGRYTIELFDSFLRMRGNKYDYKIKYDDISRLFLLPKPDDLHMAFVIALDKPIRQGQQRYQMLVMQTTKELAEVTINLDEETLQKEYGGDLQPVMQGALCNLIAKTFKIIAKKKVFVPGKFANANQQACVKCALRANEGHLYPLEKSFVFIHKPPVLIRFDEVESVEFQRYAGGQGSTRNFDLCVTLTHQASAGDGGTSNKEYTFSGIDRSDYAGLYSFLSGKKIQIKNLQGVGLEGAMGNETNSAAPVYDESIIYGITPAPGEEEESSEDEDYGSGDASGAGSEAISGDEDDDDALEADEDDDDVLEVDEDDSDLEEHRREASKKRSTSNDDNDDESSSRPKKKKKHSDANASSVGKKEKSKKDPDAPKKAMSSYLHYSNAMRSKVKEKHPDATFGEIAKIIGNDFKKLSDEEKKKWEKQASVDKARYQQEMDHYSAPEDDNDTKKSSKKSRKDPNAPKKPMTSYMMFSIVKRAEIKNDNPDASFGDMARLISAEFKKLSEKEKMVYEDMAKKDKVRYGKEMENYTPPSSSKKSSTEHQKKAKKDPNAPKKAMTAYMLYSISARPKVKAKNPAASFGDLTKLVGEEWKALDEEKKAKWEKKAKAEKSRYADEMEAYGGGKTTTKKENDDGDEDVSAEGSNDDDEDDSD